MSIQKLFRVHLNFSLPNMVDEKEQAFTKELFDTANKHNAIHSEMCLANQYISADFTELMHAQIFQGKATNSIKQAGGVIVD